MTAGTGDEGTPDDTGGRQSGAGWFVRNRDGSRSYFTGQEPSVVPPRVDRTKPKRIRFFSDDCTGIALWPDEEDVDEDDLPISPSLRARITIWVDEATAEIESGTPMADRPEHDRRGYALSRELQDELGPEYAITYLFETSEVRNSLGGTTEQ